MVKILSWEDVGLPSVSGILDACSITKSGLVYTSGSVGKDINGVIPDNVEEQTEIVINNLKTILKAAGSSIEDVVKVLIFVSDSKYISAVNEIYSKYFTTKPPRSCVVAELASPVFLVEIEVVAEVSDL